MADELMISVVGADLSKSEQIVSQLRRKLVADGAPPDKVHVAREPGSDNQNVLGEYFHLAIEGGKYVVDIAVIAYGIYEIFFRHEKGLTLQRGSEKLVIGPGELEIDRLVTMLKELIGDTSSGN